MSWLIGWSLSHFQACCASPSVYNHHRGKMYSDTWGGQNSLNVVVYTCLVRLLDYVHAHRYFTQRKRGMRIYIHECWKGCGLRSTAYECSPDWPKLVHVPKAFSSSSSSSSSFVPFIWKGAWIGRNRKKIIKMLLLLFLILPRLLTVTLLMAAVPLPPCSRHWANNLIWFCPNMQRNGVVTIADCSGGNTDILG